MVDPTCDFCGQELPANGDIVECCPRCGQSTGNANGNGPTQDVVDRKQALLVYLMGCTACTLLGVLLGLVLHDMVVK